MDSVVRMIADLSEQQIDYLLCQHLGDTVYPCGILQILDVIKQRGHHVQIRFALALRVSIIDQSTSHSPLIQIHHVLFGMTHRHCKEAALHAIGACDRYGNIVGNHG